MACPALWESSSSLRHCAAINARKSTCLKSVSKRRCPICLPLLLDQRSAERCKRSVQYGASWSWGHPREMERPKEPRAQHTHTHTPHEAPHVSRIEHEEVSCPVATCTDTGLHAALKRRLAESDLNSAVSHWALIVHVLAVRLQPGFDSGVLRASSAPKRRVLPALFVSIVC